MKPRLHGYVPPAAKKKTGSITPFGGGDAAVTGTCPWRPKNNGQHHPLLEGENATVARVHAPGGQKKTGSITPLEEGMLTASSANIVL